MKAKPIPNALYECAICYGERSWPATELFWSDIIEKWCCRYCWDGVDEHWLIEDEPIEHGVSLADELRYRGFSR